MSLHSKGTNYEKLKLFPKAIAEFKAGKFLVEKSFGTEHQLYAVFSSAMGGAKLKTKFQTPTDNRRTKSNSSSRSPPSSVDKKKKKQTLPTLKKVNRPASANPDKTKVLLAEKIKMSSSVSFRKEDVIKRAS